MVVCTDDDENAAIVQYTREKKYLVVGELLLCPYLKLLGNIYPINGIKNNLFSTPIPPGVIQYDHLNYNSLSENPAQLK